MNANLYRDKAKISITPAGMLVLALCVLVLLQLYAYAIADWEIVRNQWSIKVLASKTAVLDFRIVLPRLIAFVAIVFVMLRYSFRDAPSSVYTLVVLTFCLAHTLLAMFDIGIVTSLYSSHVPLYYLLILGFFVGRKENLWFSVKRVIPVFVLIYLAGFIYEFVSSYIQYGWVIYQNSSLMTYFCNLFWLAAMFIYIRISEKRTGVLLFLFPVLLLIGAVIIRSRSWVILSVLLLIITVMGVVWSKKRTSFKFIRMFILISVLLIISFFVISNFFDAFWNSILDKGTADTRSIQYVEIFSQTPWYKWILGQGMTATYQSNYYGEYSSIDNAFVYLSFHYGIFFAILYFLPYLAALVKTWQTRKYSSAFLFSFGIILLWLASLNGLSIFNSIVLDAKSFIMPFLAGHIYQSSIGRIQSKEVE